MFLVVLCGSTVTSDLQEPTGHIDNTYLCHSAVSVYKSKLGPHMFDDTCINLVYAFGR